MKAGDYVKYGLPGGSTGQLEEKTPYGNFYVRWVYGRDKSGQVISATDSVDPKMLMPCTKEEYERVRDRTDFGHSALKLYDPPRASLTFDELRAANVQRCESVFHKLGAWSPLEWAGAMCGEAGEAANEAKKLKRLDDYTRGVGMAYDGLDAEVLADNIAAECADVIAYLDLLCARVNRDLGEAVRKKFNEVSKKRGSGILL